MTDKSLKLCKHPIALMETSAFDEGKYFDGLSPETIVLTVQIPIFIFQFCNHQDDD